MSEREFLKVFAKRLRYYLDKNDMTQKELAQRLGVGTTSVYNWLNEIKAPRMDKVDHMCKIFGCNRSDLMTDEPDQDGYYTDPETARLAQEMFEDPQMRSLFHMKRNMEPEKFKAHYDMMKKMYQLEHPEDGDDWA